MRIGIVNCFCFNDHGGMQVVTSSIIHIHMIRFHTMVETTKFYFLFHGKLNNSKRRFIIKY